MKNYKKLAQTEKDPAKKKEYENARPSSTAFR
jgi:hypothetical protein